MIIMKLESNEFDPHRMMELLQKKEENQSRRKSFEFDEALGTTDRLGDHRYYTRDCD